MTNDSAHSATTRILATQDILEALPEVSPDDHESAAGSWRKTLIDDRWHAVDPHGKRCGVVAVGTFVFEN